MPGDRVYRTGDAAIINKDGSIDLQGRFDDQIKLRGYRIELGEIETRLNEIAGVMSAAVAVRKDNTGQEQLVGYVVMDDQVCIEENLSGLSWAKPCHRTWCRAPSITLPEMPRMPSGKINRKALPRA